MQQVSRRLPRGPRPCESRPLRWVKWPGAPQPPRTRANTASTAAKTLRLAVAVCYLADVVANVGGAVRSLAISELRLDPANPRLPPDMQDPPRSQREIALFINKRYDPLRIAESIATHRFFESEPLIAVAEGDGETFTVIEGNRRLTALLGLCDSDLRTEFAIENSGWSRLTVDAARVPQRVPVLVVDRAEDVAPLLGFRHISGIEPWDPYAQARYIAQLVDKAGHTLDEVAELVGRTPTEVKSKYRDYDILGQADAVFGIDTSRARKAFGVFNNAMGRRAIRAFIGAPDPRTVDPNNWPLAEESRDNLDKLLRIVFGGPRGAGRVITDSRQLADLAKVLADASGQALLVLEASGSLPDAVEAATDPAEQFLNSVRASRRELSKALQLRTADLVSEHRDLIRELARAADELLGDEE